MTLAARLEEMIVLYTLDQMPLRRIADRFGATEETVRMMLTGAGVSLRKRGENNAERHQVPEPPVIEPTFRGPADRHAAPVYRIDPFEPGDRKHVRAVILALGGKGFPFLAFRSAA